jgi:hypothetical protein
MSQLFRRIISLPIQSIRSFHSFDEVTPAKYISTRLKNGIGSRYVCQLQRLTIQLCKEFRTSYGTREWIANDLTTFARQHPYVVIYVQPRRHRAPNLVGEYLSGDRQWIPMSNCDRHHVNWWIHSLLTQQGDPQFRLLKQMHTDSPSIQGLCFFLSLDLSTLFQCKWSSCDYLFSRLWSRYTMFSTNIDIKCHYLLPLLSVVLSKDVIRSIFVDL